MVAGLGLAVVVGVGDRLVCGLGGGDLGLQRLDLGFERGAAFLADAPRGFGGVARLDRLLEAAGDLLQLRERRRRHLRDARQRFDAEGGIGRRLRPARIGAREPIGDVEEFAQAACGLSGRHRFAVRGGVAGVLHEARLDRERAADQRLEARLGEQRGERRVVRVFQRAIVAVEPADGGLQRQPAVERRAARIGMRQGLGPRGMPENVGKFGLQEGELRHAAGPRAWFASIHRRLYHSSPRKARCCREAKSSCNFQVNMMHAFDGLPTFDERRDRCAEAVGAENGNFK